MATTKEELRVIKRKEKKHKKKLLKQQQQQQQQQQEESLVLDPILLAATNGEGEGEGSANEEEQGKKSKKNKKRERDQVEEEEESPEPLIALDESTTKKKRKNRSSKAASQDPPIASTSALPLPATPLILSEKEVKKQRKKEAKASTKKNGLAGEGESLIDGNAVASGSGDGDGDGNAMEGVEEEVVGAVEEAESGEKQKAKRVRKSKKAIIENHSQPHASTSFISPPSPAPSHDNDNANVEDHLGEKELRKSSRKEARKLQRLAMAAIQAAGDDDGDGDGSVPNGNGNGNGNDSGAESDREEVVADEADDEVEVDAGAAKSKGKGKSKEKEPKEKPPKKKKKSGQRASMPKKEEFGNLSAQEIIATKWMSSAQLKKLEEEYGFTLKSGKFSLAEDASLKSAISSFALTHNLSPSEINKIIFSPTKELPSRTTSSIEDSSFWSTITLKLGNFRSLLSVFNRVRRIYDEEGNSNVGRWTKDEVDELKAAVREYGDTKWSEISKRVGRKPDLCRSKWLQDFELGKVGAREVAEGKEGGGEGGEDDGMGKRGKWSAEEAKLLKEAVLELGENWTVVAKKVPGRSARQCMEKWRNSVSIRDESLSWDSSHRIILLHTVAKLNVSDVSEFEWKTVQEMDKRLEGFSSSQLRKAWTRLVLIAKKKGIDDFNKQVEYLVQEIPEDSTTFPKIKNPDSSRNVFGVKPIKATTTSKKVKGKGKEVAPDIVIDSVDPNLAAAVTGMGSAPNTTSKEKGKGKEKEYKSTELVDSDDEDSSSSDDETSSEDPSGSDDSD